MRIRPAGPGPYAGFADTQALDLVDCKVALQAFGVGLAAPWGCYPALLLRPLRPVGADMRILARATLRLLGLRSEQAAANPGH